MSAEFRTSYMDQAIFDLPTVIETARKRLARVQFDTLVGTGFSGGIVIPSLALALGKQFVLIRKEDDDSHHGGGRLLGSLGERWIFVDDFISSGRTRRRVADKIASQVAADSIPTRWVGQYMYVNYNEGGPRFQRFSREWIQS